MRLAKSGYYDEKRAEAKEQTKETPAQGGFAARREALKPKVQEALKKQEQSKTHDIGRGRQERENMGAFVGLAGKALKAVLKIALFCGLAWFLIPFGVWLATELITGKYLEQVPVMNTVCNILWYMCYGRYVKSWSILCKGGRRNA